MAIRTRFKICPDRDLISTHLTIIISANVLSRGERADITGNSRSTDVPGIPSLNPIFNISMEIGLERELEFTKLHCLLSMNGLDSPVEC